MAGGGGGDERRKQICFHPLVTPQKAARAGAGPGSKQETRSHQCNPCGSGAQGLGWSYTAFIGTSAGSRLEEEQLGLKLAAIRDVNITGNGLAMQVPGLLELYKDLKGYFYSAFFETEIIVFM